MWQKRLAASLVTVAVAAALISLLWLQRMLSGVEPQRWSSWHLPVSCGLFLRALTLFLIGYLLWLCLGWLAHLLSRTAARRGHQRLALMLGRVGPRFLRRLYISGLGVGLVTALPLGTAAVAGQAVTAQAAANTIPGPGFPVGAGTSDDQREPRVPVPTWNAQRTAIPLGRTLGTPPGAAQSRPVVQEVIIRHGDTLWDIARTRLGESASIGDVAAYWPRIHQRNRDVIGADPDLLQVGMVLHLPTP
ncbi:LysM peptidoglycan-binding domain-containing protein [Glutamicibacter sp. BSL13]